MRRIQDTNVGPGDTFISRDPGTNTPGTKIRRAHKNDLQEEICRAIESTGELVDTTLYSVGDGNRDQLAQMIAHYGAGGATNYIESVGSAADVYEVEMPDLGIKQRSQPETPFKGMTVIFKPVDPNTGPSTIKVGNLPVADIKTAANADPAAGVIQANKVLILTFNDTTGAYEILEFGGGGQLLGTSSVKAILFNAQNIAENLTILGTTNAMSAGPITIDTGFTVTVETGARWVIN